MVESKVEGKRPGKRLPLGWSDQIKSFISQSLSEIAHHANEKEERTIILYHPNER